MTTTQRSECSKRTTWSRALAAAFLLAALLSGCGRAQKAGADDPANAPHVAVVKVARLDLSNTLEIASELQPFQEISVYAKVSGYIKKLYVDWGTHVRQGQLLAVLEIPELQQQVELDEASVRRSESDLARAHDELSRAESTYNVAHLTYTRLADVQKTRPELVAQEEMDVSQGKDLEASAGVSAAKDSLAAAAAGPGRGSQAALEKDKAMYRVRANHRPLRRRGHRDRRLYRRAASRGNFFQQRRSGALPPFPERSSAPGDSRAGKGRGGCSCWRTVAVRVSTTNQTFDGKIVRFSDQIDTETRTMHTEVDVPNPKLPAGSGDVCHGPNSAAHGRRTRLPCPSRPSKPPAKAAGPCWW